MCYLIYFSISQNVYDICCIFEIQLPCCHIIFMQTPMTSQSKPEVQCSPSDCILTDWEPGVSAPSLPIWLLWFSLPAGKTFRLRNKTLKFAKLFFIWTRFTINEICVYISLEVCEGFDGDYAKPVVFISLLSKWLLLTLSWLMFCSKWIFVGGILILKQWKFNKLYRNSFENYENYV